MDIGRYSHFDFQELGEGGLAEFVRSFLSRQALLQLFHRLVLQS